MPEEILRLLSQDDWKRILNNWLNKTVWVNLNEWIRLFPCQADGLPLLLSNIDAVFWDEFGIKEREDFFRLGKRNGNACLMKGMFKALQDKIDENKLSVLSAEDWKCILSGNRMTRGIWNNLTAWMKLRSNHEEHLADILQSLSHWSYNVFNDENVVEAFLLGKKHGVDRLLSECIAALSMSHSGEHLEQLKEGDWKSILCSADGTCCLVKNVVQWSRLTGSTASLRRLVEDLRDVMRDADSLLDEDDEALLKQVNAYELLMRKISESDDKLQRLRFR
jgi:hypothetical protein